MQRHVHVIEAGLKETLGRNQDVQVAVEGCQDRSGLMCGLTAARSSFLIPWTNTVPSGLRSHTYGNETTSQMVTSTPGRRAFKKALKVKAPKLAEKCDDLAVP